MSSVERGYPFTLEVNQVHEAAKSRGAYSGIKGLPEAIRLLRAEKDPTLRKAFVRGFVKGSTSALLIQQPRTLKTRLGEYRGVRRGPSRSR